MREALDFGNGSRVVWEAAAAVPFTAFCAAGTQRNATSRTASGHRVMGHPAPPRTATADFTYRRRLAVERTNGQPELMAEHVDVCIVGSGFGGSISAWRLAELYRAAGADPRASSCSSAAAATSTPTSASRWTSSTCPASTR